MPSDMHIPYAPSDIRELKTPARLEDIELDTPYMVEMPTNGITTEGQKALRDYIQKNINPYFCFPEWWEWAWVVTKDQSGHKIVGTFPKRAARWLKKEWNLKLTTQHVAEIGNIARAHTIETERVLFDLTQDFDWSRGNYGDPGSCFWGDYNHSRTEVLPSLGAYAIRFYSTKPKLQVIREFKRVHPSNFQWTCHAGIESVYATPTTHGILSESPCDCHNCQAHRQQYTAYNQEMDIEWGKGVYAAAKTRVIPIGEGLGRAWIVPHEGILYLFNAYGPYQSLAAARLLATVMGLSYKRAPLNFEPEMAVYLNGDAVAIAPVDVLEGLSETTIYTDWEDDSGYHCCNCGDRVGEDYAHIYNGQPYCAECFSDNFFYCSYCSDACRHDDEVPCDNESYCSDCANNHLQYCDICDEWMEDVCEYHYCPECGEYHEDMDEHTLEHEPEEVYE